MVKIEKIKDPASLPVDWDEYVENHSYGTIFHTRDWIDTINESYGYDFLGLVARDDNLVRRKACSLVSGKLLY